MVSSTVLSCVCRMMPSQGHKRVVAGGHRADASVFPSAVRSVMLRWYIRCKCRGGDGRAGGGLINERRCAAMIGERSGKGISDER